MSYTEDELALLSAEEREAIAEGKLDAEAADGVAGDDDAGNASEGEGETTAEASEAPAGEAESEPKAEEPKEEARDDTFVHHYQAATVDNYDAKVADIAAQKVELRRKLNEGDIDMDAYESAKDAIVAQEMSLREQKIKADIAAEQADQSSKARWLWDQEQFFAAEANAIYQDKYLLAAFDAAVRDLGADDANANQKGAWFLKEADKMVRSRFNIGKQEVTQQPAPKQQEVRKPDLSVVPKTLAHLPAADIPQTGDVDEFAHIDRLTGLELEKAVARMSEAERERYRAAA